MANRVFLHVGLPKTGTSFLQGILWSNRASLHRHGVSVPAPRRHHYRATLYTRDVWRQRENARRIAADWEHLLRKVHRASGDVLLSHELFAAATAQQARFAIEAFGGAETHVVITARDMARQLPAEWQQSVKEGSVHHLGDFVHDVVHGGPRATWFWRVQDLPDVAERWGSTLAPERVHLVTVPPKGADPEVLWSRFTSVLGIDPHSVELGRTRNNESLGRVEVELLRRVNEVCGDTFSGAGRHRWLKNLLANETLAKRPRKEKFAVDRSVCDWIVDTASTAVVGSLNDLIPTTEVEQGADPSLTSDVELLGAATETIVDLLDRQRSVAWDYKRSRLENKALKGRVAQLERQLAERHETEHSTVAGRRLAQLVRGDIRR